MNMAVPLAIQDFQQRLRSQYNDSISLPSPYRYLNGEPVRPVAPVEIARQGVFIIGAYPSARFATVDSVRDVPVADISMPFSTEVKSGCELEKHYLKPLGLPRERCWITNLVRVFLFKKGHVDKYMGLGCKWTPPVTRRRFEEFAGNGNGLLWLEEELRLASPRLVITLGNEVAGILLGVKGREPRNALLRGEVQEFSIGGQEYPVIHMAHPGIVMRKATEKNRWPDLHETHISVASEAVARVLSDKPLPRSSRSGTV